MRPFSNYKIGTTEKVVAEPDAQDKNYYHLFIRRQREQMVVRPRQVWRGHQSEPARLALHRQLAVLGVALGAQEAARRQSALVVAAAAAAVDRSVQVAEAHPEAGGGGGGGAADAVTGAAGLAG